MGEHRLSQVQTSSSTRPILTSSISLLPLPQCHAKGFDGFCPLGPVLVSSRALPNPHVLKLSTHVNGVQKQNGSADVMIFPLAK